MTAQQYTPYGWPRPEPLLMQPTAFLDYDNPAVQQFAQAAVADAETAVERAVRLYYAVRDQIRYNPYAIRLTHACFRASTVVTEGSAFCIPKAVLLAAAARSIAIPALIGLSDVQNHFTSPKLQRAMGGRDVFLNHGWAALYLEGRWLKLVPAFDAPLCARMGVAATEFDGSADAVLQQFRQDGAVQMTYLRDHGVWSDLPYVRIEDDFTSYYPATLWQDLGGDAVFGPG